MNLLYWSLSFFLSISSTTYAAAPKETAAPEPCTIRSPHTGSFFDLNPLHIPDPKTSKAKNGRDYSWNATGWDMGYNFTLNFCGGVVEKLEDLGGVEGVDKQLWRNVSAYYRQGGKVYSIGQQNMAPVIRGRKMVLNYTDGSPCPEPRKRADLMAGRDTREIVDGDKDDDESDRPKVPGRTKTTIISMLCDRDPLMPQLTLSFIASPDECTYFFEARSSAACAGIQQSSQTLSPSGVFGVIMMIAIIVYVVGGCVYSRVVLNQRGWRQLPNYALWAGIFGFFRDIVIILTSSCTRFLPSRRGYSRVNGDIGGVGSTRSGRDSESANRLIDELNEEWDDGF
ncbi:Cation-independent mannose-6-phosphate receptor CI-MPR [Extremus antarcticus]|uniref:Cation-independent mannose-6-phosphate receptor CI-MPR n=1 Tax=Extremus antarcticus TaxID=702011 RepID=A0AAJ0DS24_9PEZI|nr:Cation-independent mannose-6-phosphate receptor CI-MPR [Extremus antarcticus]